ncbi:DUF4276 family protein [Skermania piniformis]|uniref:DUF4276 family protein n=1 Tax=Skermania pinensis TaxID=39122 RepID=A0ABX8SDF7_9ACTN|nr:DUF4276 family protein [Skermania piniformis]QXQ15461.1 DUF4276 family protein [Skermania piniformis]
MAVSHLELLVEDRSTATVMKIIIPRIAPDLSFAVRSFDGKTDIEKKLTTTLRGLRSHVRRLDGAVVVVVDRDIEDCRKLRSRIARRAEDAEWSTSERPRHDAPTVMVRIAVEELEAWFLGDVSAICSAYPRVNPKIHLARSKLRAPDDVVGAADELERILNKAGYHKGRLVKTTAAADIAAHMDVENNHSPSFRAFRDGVRRLVAVEEMH